MRTEKELYQWLKERMNACSIDTMRIESNATSVGIPDVFAQGRGDDLWIELKVDLIPMEQAMRQGVKIAWRPGQKAWALRYYKKHERITTETVMTAAERISLMQGKRGTYGTPMPVRTNKVTMVAVLLSDCVGLIRMTEDMCTTDKPFIVPDVFFAFNDSAGKVSSCFMERLYVRAAL